jgi:hypothetical protein
MDVNATVAAGNEDEQINGLYLLIYLLCIIITQLIL